MSDWALLLVVALAVGVPLPLLAAALWLVIMWWQDKDGR